jgi:predicted dinucleotide-binding enzyme
VFKRLFAQSQGQGQACELAFWFRVDGGKLGTIFARAGHEVIFTHARSNEKLKKLARGIHGKGHGSAWASTAGEAAQEADALLLAVHWSRIEDVLNQTGYLSGKVVIT